MVQSKETNHLALQAAEQKISQTLRIKQEEVFVF